MSEELASGAGGTDTGAAAEILSTTAAPEPTEAPASAEPVTTPDPAAEKRAENKRLIEAERARRRADADRRAAADDRKAAEAAREEAKKATERAESFDTMIAEARRNPGKFLEATGLTLDDIVRWKLNDGEVSPELLLKDVEHRTAAEQKALRAELDALKKEREEEKQSREQAQKAQAAREAEHYFRTEIDTVLKSDADKFELTIALEEQDEVYELMRGVYVQSKGTKTITPAQAAEMVEAHLRAKADRTANTKYYATLQSKLAAASQAAPGTKAPPGKAPPPAKSPDAKAKPASALTNSTVTSPATPVDTEAPLMSREDFVEQAREKLRNRKLESAAKK
jgi:hypothetical protein